MTADENKVSKKHSTEGETNTAGEEPSSKRMKVSTASTKSDDTATKTEDHKTTLPKITPSTLLSNEKCDVQSLTVSDNHATLLITTPHDAQKSLLKLQVIPFHKDILGCNPIIESKETNEPRKSDEESSKKIVSFLKKYDFKLTSESGAEYSFYNATPGSTNVAADDTEGKGKDEGTLMDQPHGSFNVELISPASERQIFRAMPSSAFVLFNETPDLYETYRKPYIDSILEGTSLNWIQNIVEGKKEKERLLLDKPSFILNIDTKWRSHPDPFTVPRKEWHSHKAVEDLYCLGIFKERKVATLRDLTAEHIPVLKALLDEGCKAIEDVYGVKQNQLRVFVHYLPQFYHFHVHFVRLHNEIGATVERGHLVTDIIQNLEMDPDYYKKRSITYKVQQNDPIYEKMTQGSTNLAN